MVLYKDNLNSIFGKPSDLKKGKNAERTEFIHIVKIKIPNGSEIPTQDSPNVKLINSLPKRLTNNATLLAIIIKIIK